MCDVMPPSDVTLGVFICGLGGRISALGRRVILVKTWSSNKIIFFPCANLIFPRASGVS